MYGSTSMVASFVNYVQCSQYIWWCLYYWQQLTPPTLAPTYTYVHTSPNTSSLTYVQYVTHSLSLVARPFSCFDRLPLRSSDVVPSIGPGLRM